MTNVEIDGLIQEVELLKHAPTFAYITEHISKGVEPSPIASKVIAALKDYKTLIERVGNSQIETIFAHAAMYGYAVMRMNDDEMKMQIVHPEDFRIVPSQKEQTNES